MPTFDDVVTDFVAGDDLTVERTITSVPSSDTLAEAWCTVKRDPRRDTDAEAVFQKHVLPADNPGVGQITDTGGDGTGHVRFDWTAADTVLLDPDVTYHGDVQVKTTAGKTYTPITFTVRARRQSTRATS